MINWTDDITIEATFVKKLQASDFRLWAKVGYVIKSNKIFIIYYTNRCWPFRLASILTSVGQDGVSQTNVVVPIKWLTSLSIN